MLVQYGFSDLFTPFIYGAYYTLAPTGLRRVKKYSPFSSPAAPASRLPLGGEDSDGLEQPVHVDGCLRRWRRRGICRRSGISGSYRASRELPKEVSEPNMESKLPTHRREGTLRVYPPTYGTTSFPQARLCLVAELQFEFEFEFGRYAPNFPEENTRYMSGERNPEMGDDC